MIDHVKVTALLDRIKSYKIKADSVISDIHLQSLFVELIDAGAHGRVVEILKPEQMSDRVQMALVKAEPNHIKMFTSLEPGAYEDLAVAAILNKTGAALNVKDSAITRQLLKRVFEVDGEALPVLIKFREHLVLPLIDDELLNLAVSTNLQAATRYIIGEALFSAITDEALKAGLRKDPILTHALAQWGRLDVIDKVIADGYWPGGHVRMPVSLKGGVRELMNHGARDLWPTHWLTAYIKKHPIAAVVELMGKQPARQKRLLEMYSTDELRPHLKASRTLMRDLVTRDLEI